MQERSMTPEEAAVEVKKLLDEWLAPARLTRVLVSEEQDADGDDVLNVRAIYDSSSPRPEADRMFSATSFIRLNFKLVGEHRFPLLSFISSDDAQGMAA
jgi:hypothetical protein